MCRIVTAQCTVSRLQTDTRHLKEATGLVSPNSTGDGIFGSTENCTQGPCSMKLHVCTCINNAFLLACEYIMYDK